MRQCVDDETIIDECKRQMLDNLHGIVLNNDVIQALTYHDGIGLWTTEQQNDGKPLYDAFQKDESRV